MHDVTWLLAGRPASRQGHQVRGQGGLLPLAAQACTPSRMPMPFSCMYSTAECWRFAISTRVAVGFFPAIGTAAVCHQPLRPAVLCRLHKAKREIVLYTAVAHAVMAAWGLLLTATAGSQPIVASTVIGAGANIYKLQEIFPPGPSGSSSGNSGAHAALQLWPRTRATEQQAPCCAGICCRKSTLGVHVAATGLLMR